ncbi:MAG: NAD-dependent epimerase/dehydratase family protein [Candidatus Omnitrophica bacterium]|nr:NAD-dependent epimerase/dehydratase family protein [Candidatus Omnitrophota bacterium]
MKQILITGGCGFIGSNLAIALKKSIKNTNIIAFDNLSRKGSEINRRSFKRHNIEFIKGDIRYCRSLEFGKKNISLIIECAAEPSVLAGYNESPAYAIDTNLNGVINCLHLAKKHRCPMIFLSTSRVYPYPLLNQIRLNKLASRFTINNKQSIRGVTLKGISTNFPMEGIRSLYGATKYCSELLINEFCNMYNLKAVINRCSVVAGSGQWGKVDQGVFSYWMINHYFKRKLSYIGYGGQGKQVRDCLHVEDLAALILYQIKHMNSLNGKTFNVGGGIKRSSSLKELTSMCQSITGNKVPINRILKTREADIPLFISDNSKVERETSWKPEHSVEEILNDIFHWIKNNEKQIKKLT